MAGKTLIPTEGSAGGIQAGSPFVVQHYTLVQSAAPPFIASGRLAQVIDAEQSITAQGVASGLGSFIMGRAVVDSANGAGQLMIGDSLSTNAGGGAGQADNQILIGRNFAVPNASAGCQNLIVIGQGTAFTTTVGHTMFGGSIVIGNQTQLQCVALADAVSDVVIGSSAVGKGSLGVAIGSAATFTDDRGVAVGALATVFTNSVGVGYNAGDGSVESVAIGANAKPVTNGVAVGFGTRGAGSDCVVVGHQASALASPGDSMALGSGAFNPVQNWCLIGGVAPRGFTTFVFGQGLNDSVGARVFTWRTTDVFGGAGNNLQGNTLVLAAGVGTGNWPNAQNRGLDLQVGIVGAAGSAAQVYTSALAIRHSDLNIAFWGGLGAPFSNAKGVVYLKNAVTNPTVAAVAGGGILSAQGGELHWLSSAGVDTALTPGGGGIPSGWAEVANVGVNLVTVTQTLFRAVVGAPDLTDQSNVDSSLNVEHVDPTGTYTTWNYINIGGDTDVAVTGTSSAIGIRISALFDLTTVGSFVWNGVSAQAVFQGGPVTSPMALADFQAKSNWFSLAAGDVDSYWGLTIVPSGAAVLTAAHGVEVNFAGLSGPLGHGLLVGAGSMAGFVTAWGLYLADSDAFFGGDAKIGTVGKGLYVKEGANATMGRAVLVGGAVVVATTKVTATSEIFLSTQIPGGTLGAIAVTARTAGVSFTITSLSPIDTSTIAWWIVEPA